MGKMELHYVDDEFVKQWALLESLLDFPNVKHRVNIGYEPISPIPSHMIRDMKLFVHILYVIKT